MIVADSKEGPLFLMSTELGNSGDDVNIPAVLLSLADSMLLLMRQHAVTATISADGVLMQTYRQLRYAPAARLRQRDEMAWRVKFQGEGHQVYVLSITCVTSASASASTTVQILTPEELRARATKAPIVRPCPRSVASCRFSVCLRYYYISTNADT